MIEKYGGGAAHGRVLPVRGESRVSLSAADLAERAPLLRVRQAGTIVEHAQQQLRQELRRVHRRDRVDHLEGDRELGDRLVPAARDVGVDGLELNEGGAMVRRDEVGGGGEGH